MSWEDLRYLEVLSRTGTAQNAARELGVSASTIYRRVAALEADVGSACLKKGGEAGELTSAGRTLVEMAQRIQEGMGKIRGQSERDAGEVSGSVGLTTVEGMLFILHEPLQRLAEKYPQLRVDLVLADSGPSVRRHQVDVAIGIMYRPPDELLGRSLFRIEYGVYGTKEAIARDPLQWIVRGPPISFIPEAEWEDKHAGDVVLSTGSISGMSSLVERGLGVALLPKQSAQLCPNLIELTQFSASIDEIVPRHAWLLMHPEMRHTPRVRVLFDTLLECIGSK